MTIAACYLSPEGVVLGADSTTTYATEGGAHYYNHAQKLFEIGSGSTVGAVTWGLGGLAFNSYRRLFSLFADDLLRGDVHSVAEVVERWVDFFWPEYSSAEFIKECKFLDSKKPFDPDQPALLPDARTREEEDRLQQLLGNWVGFCIGGYVLQDRQPAASVCIFSPLGEKPKTTSVNPGFQFWGAPNMIQRLIFGWDGELRKSILESGKWSGTERELDYLLRERRLAHPATIPIRDAIDFVHTCILSTIKALKFSNFSQICGGPIEIAVITADRPFRWVRHKEWDSAITEGAS
jgi:hypothetical protein